MVKASRAKIANGVEVISYALDELPEDEALLAVTEVLRRLHAAQGRLLERLLAR